MSTIIKVENLSKEYRLGVLDHGAMYKDLQAWWAKLRGKEDPNSLIGENIKSESMEDRFWALQDLNFEIKAGESVGIIGKNGAGKSTLLKILSRVTTPTQGSVKIKGRVASLLEVGTGFHPELTGRENIFLNGAIMGLSKIEVKKRFDAIVDFSGVEKFIDTPVKRYSSGMRVRLGFAVAAHLEPDILIVDEVLAVGDLEFQKKCLGKMEDVGKEGRTVIFVSHNMGAVQTLCKRGIYLHKGAVSLDSNINEVVGSYMTVDEKQYKFPISNDNAGITVESLQIKIIQKKNYINLTLLGLVSIQKKMGKLAFAIQVKTKDGLLVSSIGSKIFNQYLKQNKGNQEISLTCPEINRYLVPGMYLLSFIIFKEPNKRLLELENFEAIEIPSIRTYYTLGAIPRQRFHGVTLLPWQVKIQ
ncbi:MAG: ABC transporter ATP-binding protein [Leptospirales bacterium]